MKFTTIIKCHNKVGSFSETVKSCSDYNYIEAQKTFRRSNIV